MIEWKDRLAQLDDVMAFACLRPRHIYLYFINPLAYFFIFSPTQICKHKTINTNRLYKKY
jgi:hypothetical protein